MKLLDKSIRSYLIYSAIVLIVAIPVFYVVVQRIVLEDVDESLAAQKQEIISQIERSEGENLKYSPMAGPNFIITELSSFVPHDTLYRISIYDSLSTEYIPYRVLESAVMIKGQAYSIQLKSSLIDRDDLIRSLVLVVIILLLIITGGLIFINRNLSKRIWKPFYETLSALSGYKIESEDKLDLTKTNIDEFSDLNQSLNELTGRNHRVYLSRKEFAENASHEMQTPLAVFQSKLDLLMQTTPLTEEQFALIGELSQAGQRLNRLNRTLSLLSKIENQQFPDKEEVVLKEIMEKMLDQFKDSLEQKQISVDRELDTTKIIANSTLMEILISNLLSNSIRHNKPKGKILMHLQNGELEIANEGNDTELDIERLFQRFQKQAGSSSTGLGLEIVKKICNLNGFDITYRFQKPMHRFILKFAAG